ncbi:bifunctional 5,10-methylenetetrahydrofolate dehydrogenase/5,10-methenyltetrahydrofolate cyclohydrolase [Patescibacteria group bacterium]|nr:bifunctional 5,10-methylenetetrahydrofolate dehydrogenase/5,10-methenyltetrahydrofolate cyclohydrolase [Patescibacteria group bacterium]
MIIDGRSIASDILRTVRTHAAVVGRELVVRAMVMNPTGATESYLRVKAARATDAGMRMEIARLPDNATTEEVLTAIAAPGADSVIVQLPLPEAVNSTLILDEIPLQKDADVLSAAAYERFVYRKPGALLPPVVGAIKEVFLRTGVKAEGKKSVIIGSGKLVGQPAAVWLESEGAEVLVLTQDSFTHEAIRNADIIISGAGSPGLLMPAMLKSGVVLVDAGTSELNGAIVGDADPSCVEVASVFTPVPGGLGPIAVACLFKNASLLVVRSHETASTA